MAAAKKKVSIVPPSEEKLNEYIEKRKLEVPIYDQNTGKPNLDYEKLTGKKNPMLSVGPLDLHMKMPLPYESKRNNRFLVSFPESFNIPQWVVKSSSRPSMSIIDKKIFGFTYEKVIKWDTMQIVLRDPISPSSTEKIMTVINNSILTPFNYVLELIDPTGKVVEKWFLKDSLIMSSYFGDLDYGDDDTTTITLVIQSKNIELIKI